ncbi:hypothetical protein I317_07556 [Kwoniella heveanensis CBS 569]|nr:hypothetical protein I317_07556 [Kwoniella heveanensis CBS 569]
MPSLSYAPDKYVLVLASTLALGFIGLPSTVLGIATAVPPDAPGPISEKATTLMSRSDHPYGSPQFGGCISAESFNALVHSSESYGFVSSQVDEGSCTVTFLDSPLVFEGCYPHLSGTPFLRLSDVDPHMDLELCLKICSTDVYDTEVVGFRAVELDSRGKPRQVRESIGDPDAASTIPGADHGDTGTHDNNQNHQYDDVSPHAGAWDADRRIDARADEAGNGRAMDRGVVEKPKVGKARTPKDRGKNGKEQKQKQKQTPKQRIGSDWATRWGWECACYSGGKEGLGMGSGPDHGKSRSKIKRTSKCGKGDHWRYVVSPRDRK